MSLIACMHGSCSMGCCACRFDTRTAIVWSAGQVCVGLLMLGCSQGTKINPACTAAGLEGFPSWVINGKTHSGEKTFAQLEELLAKS